MAEKAELFYAYDVLIYSNNQVWPQWVFDIIIGLFDKFGIINNVANILEMVCHPGTIASQKYSTYYGCQMNSTGYTHCVKQRRMLVFGECGA